MPQLTITIGQSTTITTDCTTINVRADTGNGAGQVRVHVPSLNAADGSDDDLLAAGEAGAYRLGDNGLSSATFTAVGGDVTLRWGAAARLRNP